MNLRALRRMAGSEIRGYFRGSQLNGRNRERRHFGDVRFLRIAVDPEQLQHSVDELGTVIRRF